MQAALITGREQVELREFPTPEPSPGRAVVEIRYCGICGTDLDAWKSGEPYNPAICGHEWTGVARALPRDVTHLKEGDRVALGIAPGCGQCAACLRADPAHCASAFEGVLGLGPLAAAHGGFAPAIAVDARRVFRVRDGVDDVAAAMLEPATVALHGVRRTGLRAGDGALLLGAGPIGLLTLQCALAGGAGAVAVVEPHETRRTRARELGACAVIDPSAEDTAERVRDIFGPLGPDVVFECAGVASTLQQAVELVRRGGTVSLLGLASGNAEITPVTWLSQEVTLIASLAYSAEEFDISMQWMLDGRLRAPELHTSTTSLGGLDDALRRLRGAPDEIKILVDPHA